MEYLTLQKRYAQVHSWLEAVEDDGRVHGRVISNGAVTGRMTHQSTQHGASTQQVTAPMDMSVALAGLYRKVRS